MTSTIESNAAEGSGRKLRRTSRYIHFGPFQVDQQCQRVTRDGARLKLQAKVYQMLMALVEKQGGVATREELKVRLWPAESHVNYDANLATLTNKLRQALGDSSDHPLYIETVHGKGYYLIVPPVFADTPLPPALVPVDARAIEKGSPAMRSNFWITLGAIALIIAGMLLGAGIAKLWIAHFAEQFLPRVLLTVHHSFDLSGAIQIPFRNSWRAN
jgi:DNA-binding winged helix-turn-helix (wHTH) protein